MTKLTPADIRDKASMLAEDLAHTLAYLDVTDDQLYAINQANKVLQRLAKQFPETEEEAEEKRRQKEVVESALKLEAVEGEPAIRGFIFDRMGSGAICIGDIFEGSVNDVQWYFNRHHNHVTKVVADGNEFIEPDCLTTFEAAQAAMK